MRTQHDHHDHLSVRLSVATSRLLAGESLELKVLTGEFGVSERILQQDFQQRLIHLGLEHHSGSYRLIRQTGRERLPNTFAFIRNSGISGIIPAQNRRLIWLTTNNSGVSPCLIRYGALSSPVTQTVCLLKLTEVIRDYRTVTLLINDKSYETIAPRRLIFQSKNWFLVITHTKNLQVSRMEDVNAVTVLGASFRRKPEFDALTANEGFTSAFPHFRFISDVIQTFRE